MYTDNYDYDKGPPWIAGFAWLVFFRAGTRQTPTQSPEMFGTRRVWCSPRNWLRGQVKNVGNVGDIPLPKTNRSHQKENKWSEPPTTIF